MFLKIVRLEAVARLEPQDVLEDREGRGDDVEIEIVEDRLLIQFPVKGGDGVGAICETEARTLARVTEAVGIEAIGRQPYLTASEIDPEKGESTRNLFEELFRRIAQQSNGCLPAFLLDALGEDFAPDPGLAEHRDRLVSMCEGAYIASVDFELEARPRVAAVEAGLGERLSGIE